MSLTPPPQHLPFPIIHSKVIDEKNLRTPLPHVVTVKNF